MAPTAPPLINPSLRTNGGDDGAAGALASATSAEKKEGSRAPRGPKVSNNFDPVPARRNPARGAKFEGGVAESEAAGGTPRKKPHGQSPRKKPRGEGTFLLRLDREKAATERGRKESIGLVEDRAEDGCPKEAKFGPHDPPHQLPRASHPSDGRGCWRRRRCGGFVHVGGEKTRTKGFEMKISNNFGSPRRNPPPSSLDRRGKRAGDRGHYS